MNRQDLFDVGRAPDLAPQSDVAHRAVDSLRGYAYQALNTALAWLDIEEVARLYLEVAEDYAVVIKQALQAVQVKDTGKSRSVTLNSVDVRNAIASFVDLTARNPDHKIHVRFLTSSTIGKEKRRAQRPAGMAGLLYWRQVAADTADVRPLRLLLESDRFPKSVIAFSRARNDSELRSDLIERIEWDCGKPDFFTLRRELEERLVVVGRERFQLPELEARRLVDTLVFEVLQTAVVEDPNDRLLSRARLYTLIDQATRVSVRRADLTALTAFGSVLTRALGDGGLPSGGITSFALDWLMNGDSLPPTPNVVVRREVESALSDALVNCGNAVLVGSSGLGKSLVSRAVCQGTDHVFVVADFRDTTPQEAKLRLSILFAQVSGLHFSTLVLEDLNQLENPQVSTALGRVLQALRRRDRTAIITCHRRPSPNAYLASSVDEASTVLCPYFSKTEVAKLVNLYKGDAKTWAGLAYLAGGLGHPQLTHAFVNGAAARGWPEKDLDSILIQGFSSQDTDAARDSARRYIFSTLSEGKRNLLYRLSLVAGRFNRTLALALGELSPSIHQCGDALEELIGPWIEAVSEDYYRVSPLAKDFGRKSLGPSQQQRVHEAIALHLLKGRAINASDIDAIVLHAMAGKSVISLTLVTHIVLSEDTLSLEKLSDHLTLFRFLRTDVPIYPDDPTMSAMLRLAQLRLATARLGDGDIEEVLKAFLDEIEQIPRSDVMNMVEFTALFVILGTIGIANHIENWLTLLTRLRKLLDGDSELKGLVGNLDDTSITSETAFFSGLFSVGSANISRVDRLECIIEQLDELDGSEREQYLTPIDVALSDYAVLINSAWVAQRNKADFNARDAALRYGRMATKSRRWRTTALSLQCTVAQAVMLDEYLLDKDGALEVLEEAMRAMGPSPVLSRAAAKVYFNASEYVSTLRIYRKIADQVGVENPIERAYALRDAAISAGQCGSWQEAEEWFGEARKEALSAAGEDMKAMAIGLGADAAVAALETGRAKEALSGLAEAVQGLRGLDPDSTLRAAYCHRVIRHAILWTQSRIEGRKVLIGGEPIRMTIGSCSNPDPLPGIRDLPLAHIDNAWYMLAQAETIGKINAGITCSLKERLQEGPIPVSECYLRRLLIEGGVSALNAAEFARHFRPYVESSAYIMKEGKGYRENFDPRAPERKEIPKIGEAPPYHNEVEQVSKDAILAFAIWSALEGRLELMTDLEVELKKHFHGTIPGQIVFRQVRGQKSMEDEVDRMVGRVITNMGGGDYLSPEEFWYSGLKLFEWVNQSAFKGILMSRLAARQRSGWQDIIEGQTFYLIRPKETVPPIRKCLSIPSDHQSFLAQLLLVTSDAVGSKLSIKYRQALREMASHQGAASNGT